MIVDSLENWRRIGSNPAWRVAFEYLQSLTADAPDGEISLQGDDIFARVMSYETKLREEASFEAHREYLDIQSPLRVGEGIEWHPLEGLTPREPYEKERDVTFYHTPPSAPARVELVPGLFAVLFAEDAHMPQLALGNRPTLIKKVVVKMRLRLVEGR